ncbi:MAG: translocation/assembly module TamB domain-containing protein [Bacteroidota bacterium]
MIFSLLLSVYLVFRSEAAQTLMVRMFADYLSRELKTDCRVSGFDLSFRNGLVIQDILLKDNHGGILFKAHELGVKPGFMKLRKHKINIRRVYIEKGNVQLITYRGDSSLNLQYIIDHFASKDTVKKMDTTPSAHWDISISSVYLADTRFHLQDQNAKPSPAGIDYTNIDVSAINLDLTDVAFVGDTIHGNIKHLAAKERSGFTLHNLSGEFQVGPGYLKAHHLKILTDNSDLALKFDFLYDRWGAYNDFLHKVNIQASIEPSYLDLEDIGYFAPELSVMKDRIRFSANIKGNVSNFKVRDLRFAYGKNTFFYGNLSATGLPDIEETFIDLNIKEMNANKEDVETLLIPGSMRHITLPKELANIGVVGLKGVFTGFYNDFVANAHVNTNLGNIVTDLTLVKHKGSKLLGYKGQLAVESFDVGKLTGNTNLLGVLSLKADVTGKGLTLKTADLAMNLHIDSIYLNHYNYKNLGVTGAFAEEKFKGKVNIGDPNLDMDFNGLIDVGDSLPVFDFLARINHAGLFRLNLLKRDSVDEISARVKVNFKGNNLDNIDGSILIDSLEYLEGSKRITMDHFSLLTRQDTASGKSYHLQSDFLDADIAGNFSFKELIPSLTTFISNYLASFNLHDSLIKKSHGISNQVMNFEVRFHKSDELTHVFLPFLRITQGSAFDGSYNAYNGTMVVRGKAPALFLNNFEFDNWYLNAENTSDNLEIKSGASQVYLKRASKKDSLEVKVDDFKLNSNIRHDSIKYRLAWNAQSKPSELEGNVNFTKSPVIQLKISKFHMFFDEKYWGVDPANFVQIDSSAIHLSNLLFFSGEQFLKLDGNLSSDKRDTLSVHFNKVDISRVDQLIGSNDVDLDGILDGNCKIANPYKNIAILADLRINKLKFNKESLGDATFRVKFDQESSRFDLLSEILYTGNVGTNIPFSLSGSYFLDKKNPHIDFDLTLKNLNLKMVGPFVSSFMTGVGGFASGHVKIKGRLDKPDIRGELKMARTEFKINYLNVPYSFADVVKIDTNAFIFNNITVFDSLGHKAFLNGRITHQNFSNLRLDLHAEMDDFCAFNNSRAQNNIFYGNARATGTASITGPPENISITVKATNGGKTHVVIPIDLTRSVGQNDYIIFVNPKGDSAEKKTVRKEVNTSGLTIDLGLRINDEAEVEVYFPNQLGNLKGSGSGNLLMGMTPTTPFTLSGTYTVSKGYFLFQLKNYLRLPMSIKEGGTISWTGDPTDAKISLSAVYKTKAPLKGVVTAPDLEALRIPVECIIRLDGKLMNPDISFAINLPNVEESIKSQVFSVIDTTNAAVMADQTIYLLVMNQFKPVVNGSGSTVDVGGTAFSLVTNQLNSMISQISPNVNVNMNYKPGTSTTQQEFDVGISTQLFDDRLLIDGTFGMNSYTNKSAAQQSNTIVGDINIEYVLTRNRRWRVRAFNRTNTMNLLNYSAPYTQGVGIKYQRDFSTFGELFNFSRKKDAK